MSSADTAAWAVSNVVAAAEQRRQEEEMAKYTDADLQEDWEFKILRCNTAAFRKPGVLEKACQEEAAAGWTLVEKFDNQRLRFKRPMSARENDSSLDYDPYRILYGMSNAAINAITFGCIILAVLLIIGIAFISHLHLIVYCRSPEGTFP